MRSVMSTTSCSACAIIIIVVIIIPSEQDVRKHASNVRKQLFPNDQVMELLRNDTLSPLLSSSLQLFIDGTNIQLIVLRIQFAKRLSLWASTLPQCGVPTALLTVDSKDCRTLNTTYCKITVVGDGHTWLVHLSDQSRDGTPSFLFWLSQRQQTSTTTTIS
eukprot:GEZU01019081.1.p1 GENE.GEZU01019081.1~~GEZU01019081.1.p1  ORF type:complete len:161 (+),score=6.49 GEZU01019081.1:129-611(+)